MGRTRTLGPPKNVKIRLRDNYKARSMFSIDGVDVFGNGGKQAEANLVDEYDVYRELGKVIKAERKKRGWARDKVGSMIERQRGAVEGVEIGRTRDKALITAVAEAVGVDIGPWNIPERTAPNHLARKTPKDTGSISYKIKVAREAAGMTMTDLAGLLSDKLDRAVSRSSISALEARGTRDVRVGTLAWHAAKELNIQLEELE